MTPLGDRQEQILRKRDCKLIDMEHRVSDIFVIYWLSSGKTTLRLNSFNLFRSRRTKAITIKNLMRSSKDLHMTLFQLKTEDCQEKQDLKKLSGRYKHVADSFSFSIMDLPCKVVFAKEYFYWMFMFPLPKYHF